MAVRATSLPSRGRRMGAPTSANDPIVLGQVAFSIPSSATTMGSMAEVYSPAPPPHVESTRLQIPPILTAF
ncbi:MAG TPA: hypothetical protein PLN41_00255 [Methanothrix sp.]|nr:hypothetical protein [Methanothrix sp.]HNT72168.1 hypothetical protein [Methanothrix sp.]HOI68165.1 hypothetical protein [Methanothrix sp.]